MTNSKDKIHGHLDAIQAILDENWNKRRFVYLEDEALEALQQHLSCIWSLCTLNNTYIDQDGDEWGLPLSACSLEVSNEED